MVAKAGQKGKKNAPPTVRRKKISAPRRTLLDDGGGECYTFTQ
jgi:hypothetical protein